MINVKSTEPCIFITCDIRSEEALCREVLDVLFSYGIDAKCLWFYGVGVVIIYLKNCHDTYTIVKHIISRNVRGYWVIPIDFVCSTRYEHIMRCAINSILLKELKLPIRIIGRCRKRGNFIDSCSSLLKYVGNVIESLGIAIVDFHNYDYVMRIEIVYENTFISVYRKIDENLFRVRRIGLEVT